MMLRSNYQLSFSTCQESHRDPQQSRLYGRFGEVRCVTGVNRILGFVALLLQLGSTHVAEFSGIRE